MVNVGDHQLVRIDNVQTIRLHQVKMTVHNSYQVVYLQDQNVSLHKLSVLIISIFLKRLAMQYLIHRGINVPYLLPELALARLGNVQMLQQIALPIYRLVYLVELHARFNKQHVIYIHHLHNKHVMM